MGVPLFWKTTTCASAEPELHRRVEKGFMLVLGGQG